MAREDEVVVKYAEHILKKARAGEKLDPAFVLMVLGDPDCWEKIQQRDGHGHGPAVRSRWAWKGPTIPPYEIAQRAHHQLRRERSERHARLSNFKKETADSIKRLNQSVDDLHVHIKFLRRCVGTTHRYLRTVMPWSIADQMVLEVLNTSVMPEWLKAELKLADVQQFTEQEGANADQS